MTIVIYPIILLLTIELQCFSLQMLVTASRALLLKQWDWKQENCNRSWKAIHNVPVASMTFDCTSTLLATGGTQTCSIMPSSFNFFFSNSRIASQYFCVILIRLTGVFCISRWLWWHYKALGCFEAVLHPQSQRIFWSCAVCNEVTKVCLGKYVTAPLE